VRVAESIGTGGAVAALRDGAIDVGLASRPLAEEELAAGFREHPVATTRHVLAVRSDLRVAAVASTDLVALLRRERTAWADGSPALVLLREPGDSGDRLVRRHLPEVGEAIDAARAARQWPVCYTDQQMRDALLELQGAVGFIDLGTIRAEGLPCRALAIDGRDPAAGQDYPLTRALSLLLGPRSPPEATAFVAFSGSPAGQAALAGAYLPPPGAIP
jgi:phosphate transport system substrate-binding protein